MNGHSRGRYRSRDFVQSFERGLTVIRALSGADRGLTLSDVARATDLPRAAVRRFLLTLEALGYVDCDGRLFRLSPRVLELSYAYLASSGRDALLEAINVGIPHARASHEDLDRAVLPSLLTQARAAGPAGGGGAGTVPPADRAASPAG